MRSYKMLSDGWIRGTFIPKGEDTPPLSDAEAEYPIRNGVIAAASAKPKAKAPTDQKPQAASSDTTPGSKTRSRTVRADEE